MSKSIAPEPQISGLTYKPEDIIQFKRGLPGFESLKRFIISSAAEHAPFHWLHSLEEPGLRFVLVNPMLVMADYDPRLTKVHLEDIGIRVREDILMYVIVTIDPHDGRKSTVNMLGPILVNIREKLANQVILDDARYSTRQQLFGGDAC